MESARSGKEENANHACSRSIHRYVYADGGDVEVSEALGAIC